MESELSFGLFFIGDVVPTTLPLALSITPPSLCSFIIFCLSSLSLVTFSVKTGNGEETWWFREECCFVWHFPDYRAELCIHSIVSILAIRVTLCPANLQTNSQLHKLSKPPILTSQSILTQRFEPYQASCSRRNCISAPVIVEWGPFPRSPLAV